MSTRSTHVMPVEGRPVNEKTEMLRHSLATLAYRTGRAVRDAPPAFGTFSIGSGARTPHEVLGHMCDLMRLTLCAMQGRPAEDQDLASDFEQEVDRFNDLVRRLTQALSASSLPADRLHERLLQGPVSDALTHVGQLALLRRLAGSPIEGEDYFSAPIHADDLDGSS